MSVETFDLILAGGRVVTPAGIVDTDVGVRAGRIAAIRSLDGARAETTVSCRGLTVLPGVIDSQVHFREPGLEHKEDLATGTAAAAMGGVTTIFEMPNTSPPTVDPDSLADKLDRAAGRASCDFAFFLGASPDNAEDLAAWERLPGCAGVKIFMGSSTGSLLVEDDATLRRVLASGRRRVAVHAEDEPRLRSRSGLAKDGGTVARHPDWRDVETAVAATRRLLTIAREVGRPVHVLHITTEEEMALLAEHKDIATVEVTPQHLTLVAPDCYDRLGSRAQMNPPVRDGRHRDGLWRAVTEGVVDVLGSDHAPHTLEEKARTYPGSPSGMPGVQTLVPILLNHVAEGRITLERFVDLTGTGPARAFGIARKGRIAVGYDADFTVVDLAARRTITDSWIASRCGWTPFDGMTVTGWPMLTIVRGAIVMRDGERAGDPAGRMVRFVDGMAGMREPD